MNDTFGMEIAHGAEHLLDEPCTLGFRIMVVRLLVEAIKELPTETKLLHQIDLTDTLVDFFEPDNIGMIQLTHDEYFLSELPQSFSIVHEPEIEYLDGILDAGRFMGDEPHRPGDATAQDRPGMHAIIDLFNRLPKRDFQMHHVLAQVPVRPTILNQLVQSNFGSRMRE